MGSVPKQAGKLDPKRPIPQSICARARRAKRATRARGLRLLAALLLTVTCPRGGLAAEAVFTRDGMRLYLFNNPRRIGDFALASVDVTSGQATPISLPRGINASGEPCALARSKSGFLLILFGDSLWAYDPVKKTSAKVCAAEAKNAFYDVACDPVTGQIFIGGKTGLGYLEGDGSKLRPVSVRRVDQFGALTVLQKGHLLFAVGGDGWSGRINREPLEGGRTFTTLLAYRFAPLATLETGNYTPAVQGAAEFAITDRWLYVHVRRFLCFYFAFKAGKGFRRNVLNVESSGHPIRHRRSDHWPLQVKMVADADANKATR